MKRNSLLSKRIIIGILAFALAALTAPLSGFSADFDQYIMPVSNPVYLGDARNVTMVRPLYLYQNLPDKVETRIGTLPLGGHVNGFAVQVSYAFSDRFSFVAVKDGYIDCEPDETLNHHSGWADIAAGLQYSFIYRPEKDYILTGRLVYELPSGSDQIYQSNGDGNFAPSMLFLKGYGALQFSGTLGFVIPVDNDEENTLFYDAWHLSYAVTDWFRPLVELNHFYVIDSGDRDPWVREAVRDLGLDAALDATLGTSKEDDVVASVAEFNACDLVNLGGRYNDKNRNLVTLALGARFRAAAWLDFGAVYEFALTDEEKGLLEDRYMVDAMVTLRF